MRRILELTGDDEGPTVILPVLATDVGHVGDLVATLPYDRAHAASSVQKHDALMGTYQRVAYAGVLDETEIIDL